MKTFLLTLYCYLSLLVSGSYHSAAQSHKQDSWEKAILQIIDSSHAHIGLAIKGIDFPDSFMVHANDHFPMQSVFKFPLALRVLQLTEDKVLFLNQVVHIRKGSLDTTTWSPMLRDFPDQDMDPTIRDLLAYTVSASDNNTCDLLFYLAGGTRSVNNYIRRLGITGMSITATEAQMRKGWEVQYSNWSEPAAMAQLLADFYKGKILSGANRDLLLRLMTESTNSAKRIKGLLPPNTVVAHKTGTSDNNKDGLKAATNDAGILTLPDGRHLAIVVFVSDYMGGTDKGENIIAALTKLAWDHYTAKK